MSTATEAASPPKDSCAIREMARNSTGSGFVESLAIALSGTAMRTLLKATSDVPKLALPKHTETLVELTYKRGSATWDAPKEVINKWLVEELMYRVRRSKDLVVAIKSFLLIQDLVVLGDASFVAALTAQPDFFDMEKMSLAQELADKPAYAHTLRFFLTFVHAQYEFYVRQPRVREAVAAMKRRNSFQFVLTSGEPLFNDSPNATSSVNSNNNTECNVMLRDAKGEFHSFHASEVGKNSCSSLTDYTELGLDGIALLRYIVVADTNVPNCFVAVEVFVQYVEMAKRLFSMTTHALHHLLATHSEKMAMFATRDVAVDRNFLPLKNVQDRKLFVTQYERMTTQLKAFFEQIEAAKVTNERLQRIDVPQLSPLPESVRRYRLLLDEISKAFKRDEGLQQSDASGKIVAIGGVAGLVEISDLKSTLSSSSLQSQSLDSEQPPKTTLTPPISGATSSESSPMMGGSSSSNNKGAVPWGAQFDDFRSEMLTVDKLFGHAAADAKSGSGGISSSDRFDRDEDSSAEIQHLNTVPHIAEAAASNPEEERFRIMEDQILGRGGNGIVYRAWDDVDGRHVACKQILLNHDGGAAMKELQREYQVLTTLSHPNIVKVVGFVAKGGQGRIFMEWMPSGSVLSVMQEAKRGLRDGIVRRYLREALQGLEYLHGRGIMHRDIKPGNMLLSATGEVKLTDFGTVRSLDNAQSMVKTGTVVGTVPYLAPESIQGSYSAASDVWALGCTALHMATGKAPWADESRDTVGLIFKLGTLKDGELPAAVNKTEVPNAALRNFIAKAMTFERTMRPAAKELLTHPFLLEA